MTSFSAALAVSLPFAPKTGGMKAIAALAERTTILSLKLLAALHVLFFLAFLASLLAATGRV